MRRRPWPIVILALLQIFVEPISNVLISSELSGLSPSAYLAWFIQHQEWIAIAYLMLLPPVLGVAIYAMKRWSYPVFLLGAAWMLYENFVEFGTSDSKLVWVLGALLYLGNIAFVTYFLLPSVQRAYLDKKLHWWESKPRFLVDISVMLVSDRGDRIEAKLEDISEGGAYVVLPAKTRDLRGDSRSASRNYRILWNLDGMISGPAVSLAVQAVFSRPVGEDTQGYGLSFDSVSKEDRATLRTFCRFLRSAGYPVRGVATSAWEDFTDWAKRLFRSGKGVLPEYAIKKAPRNRS